MRDKNIVQFVGVCMGRSEEGQPDEAMMIQVGRGGQGKGGVSGWLVGLLGVRRLQVLVGSATR